VFLLQAKVVCFSHLQFYGYLSFSVFHLDNRHAFYGHYHYHGWFGSRVVNVLDSGAEGPGFKLQSRRCRVTVLGKVFMPIVPLFTKQRNW